MILRLYPRRIVTVGRVLLILMLAVAFQSSGVYAQHLIRDGHFNSGGGIREGTGHRIFDSAGSVSGTGQSSNGTTTVMSGFWYHAAITSTVEVAVTTFQCRIKDGSVHLSWELVEDNQFRGINILRAEEGRSPERVNKEPLSPAARSFIDRRALPGRTYIYQLEIIRPESGTIRSFMLSAGLPPRPLTLFQNYPNPFNPATTISFYLPDKTGVQLNIYDVRGRMVRELVSGNLPAGSHTAVWNGTGRRDEQVGSGVYFYVLETGKSRLTRKLVLMR